MLPLPDAVHVPPPAPTQVHVQVSAAGNVSATRAPEAANAVGFDAVIVYVTDPPGVAVVTPSVFVIATSVPPAQPATPHDNALAASTMRYTCDRRRQIMFRSRVMCCATPAA